MILYLAIDTSVTTALIFKRSKEKPWNILGKIISILSVWRFTVAHSPYVSSNRGPSHVKLSHFVDKNELSTCLLENISNELEREGEKRIVLNSWFSKTNPRLSEAIDGKK